MELRLLDTKEVSELLKIHPETVRRFIREGRIKAYLVGKQKLVREEEIKNFIEKSTRVNTRK